jgi:Zn-dependent peptidase ImmA (M78 family)
MLRLNTPSRDLDTNIIRKITQQTIKWCQETYGVNDHRPGMKWKVIRNPKEDDVYGIYVTDDNCIEIYSNHMDRVSDILLTCIHEYTHYLQQPFLTKMLRVAYSRNMYQKKAENTAQKDYRKCWNHIKSNIF